MSKNVKQQLCFCQSQNSNYRKEFWLNCIIDFWYSIHIRGFCDWFQTKCTWSYHKLLSEKVLFWDSSSSRSEILDSLYALRKCKHSNYRFIFLIFFLKIIPSNNMMSEFNFHFFYIILNYIHFYVSRNIAKKIPIVARNMAVLNIPTVFDQKLIS